MFKNINSSWEKVAPWYDKSVGEKGHYYHQSVIIPNLLRLIAKSSHVKLLDLGCGQAVLSRSLPDEFHYCGVDLSESLIQSAKQRSRNKNHQFLIRDLSENIELPEKDFTHATMLLSLQNIPHPLSALKNGAAHLQEGGRLILVLNHPCFRIPRQSSWEIDEKKKLQFRRLDRYLTPLEVPIAAHPGSDKSEQTISYHFPLSSYTSMLQEAGFVIELMEEWCSDKESVGKAAKMENFSRKEFPLFLAVIAKKTSL